MKLSRLFGVREPQPKTPIGPDLLEALRAADKSVTESTADLERLAKLTLALEQEAAALGRSHPFVSRMRKANQQLGRAIVQLGRNTEEISRALASLHAAVSTLKEV